MDESPLSTLPPELRAAIYELSLISDEPIPIRSGLRVGDIGSWTMPSLLQSCRQIRQEASPIYFKANIFHVVSQKLRIGRAWSPHNVFLTEWLGLLRDEERELLRTIHIDDMFYPEIEVRQRIENCKEEMSRSGLGIHQAAVFVELRRISGEARQGWVCE